MFRVYENVVYPGHGVARIDRIIERNIGGSKISFYELSFLNKDATVLVPTENSESVGLRSLSSEECIKDIFQTIDKQPPKNDCYEFSASSWNKRNKSYQLKLRKGGLRELLEIYNDLRMIGSQKKLSFGEKNLLSHAEALLVEEISIVCKLGQGETIERLRESCI